MVGQPIQTTAPVRPGLGRWVLLAATAVAVGVHLWGLYRRVGPPTPPWFPTADKLEHLIGFGAPVLLVLLVADRFRIGPARRRVPVVIGVFAAHAVVSELVQHFFYTDRTGDPFDVLADWTGVALGWLAYRLVRRRPAARP